MAIDLKNGKLPYVSIGLADRGKNLAWQHTLPLQILLTVKILNFKTKTTDGHYLKYRKIMIEFAYIVNCYTAKLPNFQHKPKNEKKH